MTGRMILFAPLAAAALAASAAAMKAKPSSPGAAAATAASSTTDPTSPTEAAKCPEWLDGVPVPAEHASDVCDFAAENNPAAYAANGAALRLSMNSGALFRMKDERTWICPEDEAVTAEDYDSSGKGAHGGHPLMERGGTIAGPKTKWIVRNRSSNPVSVALVDMGRGGKEVSAANPKISPAHNDPQAVLAPGQWKALTVTLGTVLHVRELLRAGAEVSPGRVLIRHRPGPVAVRDTTVKPVKKKAAANKKPAAKNGGKKTGRMSEGKKGGSTVKNDRKLKKKPPALPRNTTSVSAKAKARQVLRPVLPDASPPLATRAEKEAERGKFSFDRMCNSLNRLFVNRVGRPVDVYWAGASDLTGDSTAVSDRARDCKARFAFHLGMSAKPHEGFFEAWDSYMSVENSYVGHHFVARSATNHTKILHEIVLDRTDVGDCVREREAEAAAAAGEGVGVLVGGKVEEGEAKNVLVHEIDVDGYRVAASNLTSGSLGAVGTAAA